MCDIKWTSSTNYKSGSLPKVSALLCSASEVKCAFMSNNIEQNGRQLSTEQAAPPTDPRTRNPPPTPTVPDSQRICRDFVWGICLMNEHCKYRHELEFGAMRSILRFCHDYQNRTGCTRADCTYLHTSREEENLFLTTGQIPRVLAERYATMTMPVDSTAESTSQMMYMNEYITQPPPPPPPPLPNSSGPPSVPSQSVPAPVPAPVPPPPSGQIPASISGSMPVTMPGSMSGAMPPSMCNGPMPSSMVRSMNSAISGSMHPSMAQMPMCGMIPAQMPVPRPMEHAPTLSQMQMPAQVPTPMSTMLVPPPPPPPPPPTVTTASTRMTAPIYTAAPVQQTFTGGYPINPQQVQPLQPVPAALPVIYDPSRPPPPLPAAQNRAQKRSATEDAEAGPSKARKSDGPHDSLCENCVQRELRNELYRQELETLQRDDEYLKLLLEERTNDYENSRAFIRSLFSPELFRVLEEHIETNTSVSSLSSDLFPSTTSPPYTSQGHSTVPKQFLLQLMDYVLNTSKNTEHVPSIEPIIRRASPQPQQDVLSSLLDLIRNSATSESRHSSLDALNTNGMARLTNGPIELPSQSSSTLGPRYPAALPTVAAVNSPRYSAPPPQHPPRPFQPAADQSTTLAAPAASIMPPAFVSYPPVPPPTSLPFYQPYHGTTPNVAYTSPVAPQAPGPSTSTVPAASSVNGQSYAQYMARLPHQYYPPFQ